MKVLDEEAEWEGEEDIQSRPRYINLPTAVPVEDSIDKRMEILCGGGKYLNGEGWLGCTDQKRVGEAIVGSTLSGQDSSNVSGDVLPGKVAVYNCRCEYLCGGFSKLLPISLRT